MTWGGCENYLLFRRWLNLCVHLIAMLSHVHLAKAAAVKSGIFVVLANQLCLLCAAPISLCFPFN